MGTNYYLYENVCEHCNRGDNEKHIGKSSGGWCFGLHVIPEERINNLGDWIEYLSRDGITIKDEYGDNKTLDELLDIIRNRSSYSTDEWILPNRYNSWGEFHKMNHSEFGPNNLLRHKIDNRHCVGHGPGTYDYITGDFC